MASELSSWTKTTSVWDFFKIIPSMQRRHFIYNLTCTRLPSSSLGGQPSCTNLRRHFLSFNPHLWEKSFRLIDLRSPAIQPLFHLCFTAKTQYQKFETNISRKGLARPIPNFHMHVSVKDLYIPTIGLPILLQEICGLIPEIYKSLTDTWMWKLGLKARNYFSGNTKMGIFVAVFAILMAVCF